MIELYYWPTPNGHKVTMFLEEAGLDYTIHPVDISAGDQFKPDFLAISPNNRMPAIIDTAPADGGESISVFESGAILLYLAERIGRFLPKDVRGRNAANAAPGAEARGGLGRESGSGLELAGCVPLGALHERIVRRLGKMVGVVGDQLGRGENEDVEHRAIIVAGGLERRNVGGGDDATITRHLGCELAQGFELWIGDGAAFPDGRDRVIVDLRHAREVGVPRHAIGALIFVDDGEINGVALLRRETGLLGNAPERAVGLERRRALGEDTVEVRHKTPSLLDAIQDDGRSCRGGARVVKREPVDHFSSPYLY